MILVYLKHLTKETEEWMNYPQEAKNLRGRSSSPKLIREKRQTRPRALYRRLVSGTGFCSNGRFFILHLLKGRGSSCHLSNHFFLLLVRKINRKKERKRKKKTVTSCSFFIASCGTCVYLALAHC